jgi:very-short-patch-repair endonuclease
VPEVYALLGVELTSIVAAHAAVLAAGPNALASHTTAAALLGLPGFRIRKHDLHVVVPDYSDHLRTNATVHRTLRLPDHYVRTVDDIPCTSITMTLFHLCGMFRIERAERVIDTALARRLVTLPALGRVLTELAARGRSGSAAFRRIVTERAGHYVPPESELEARFAALVADAGLPRPRRQVDLGDSDTWLGRVDFLFASARLAVEVDGAPWHTSLTDRRADRQRDAKLRTTGFRVERFTWDDVTERPDAVVRRLRQLLVSAA